jgi:predicted nuclease of predicted toxin-antitoxin system
MTIWVDAHLSPEIASWISNTLGVKAIALRDLGLRDAEDTEIFEAAKAQRAIVITKDSDFVDLVERLGSPPQIIWLTCGNTSNARLHCILSEMTTKALELLKAVEVLIEIRDSQNNKVPACS